MLFSFSVSKKRNINFFLHHLHRLLAIARFFVWEIFTIKNQLLRCFALLLLLRRSHSLELVNNRHSTLDYNRSWLHKIAFESHNSSTAKSQQQCDESLFELAAEGPLVSVSVRSIDPDSEERDSRHSMKQQQWQIAHTRSESDRANKINSNFLTFLLRLSIFISSSHLLEGFRHFNTSQASSCSIIKSMKNEIRYTLCGCGQRRLLLWWNQQLGTHRRLTRIMMEKKLDQVHLFTLQWSHNLNWEVVSWAAAQYTEVSSSTSSHNLPKLLAWRPTSLNGDYIIVAIQWAPRSIKIHWIIRLFLTRRQ